MVLHQRGKYPARRLPDSAAHLSSVEPADAVEAQGDNPGLLQRLSGSVSPQSLPKSWHRADLSRTIAAISWQIQQSYNLSDRDDSTFSLWPFVVAMTLAQCLGVITASLPYLKPFLDSLESGLIRSDDILRRANLSKKPNSSYYRSQSRSTPTPALELRDLGAHGMSGATAAITAERGETGAEWDRASESSQRKLIQQTRTWGITRTPAGEAVGVPPVDLEAGGETGVKTAAGS